MNYMNNYPYIGFQYQPYMQNAMQPQQYISQPVQGINGKIVDGVDVVKATEVPSNGYGVFPKADLSEIYVKSWNSSGNTSIITFRPVAETAETDVLKVIEERFDQLESKIDGLQKKEIKANEY